MVIRLIAVPDSLDLTDFDDIFHAVLGWDSGIGYAFQIQGHEFNSFQRKNRSKKIRDFCLHRQEKFLYSLGALDQWEWEFRVIDLQDGAEADQTPVCVGGRGATPPQDSGCRPALKSRKFGPGTSLLHSNPGRQTPICTQTPDEINDGRRHCRNQRLCD